MERWEREETGDCRERVGIRTVVLRSFVHIVEAKRLLSALCAF